MRHVILGSNTTIGSAVVRLLASINAPNIVAVSPIGDVPEGVDPKRVDPVFGDITDPFTIIDLFEEGDILYHCQIVSNESQRVEEAELYNKEAFIRLLGIATISKVEKIVCAMPQALGYQVPLHAAEDEFGDHPSPIQNTLRYMYDVIGKYHRGEQFGWTEDDLDQFSRPLETRTDEASEGISNGSIQEEKPGSSPTSSGPAIGAKSPSLGPSVPSGPTSPKNPSTGPTISSSSGPSIGGPSLGPKQASPTSTGPSLGPNLGSDPSSSENISEKQEEGEENPEKEEFDSSELSSTSDEIHQSETPSENVSEVKIQEVEDAKNVFEYEPVPLIVGRIARLFGPFDTTITDSFCRSIRLQRISIIGDYSHKITWINPIDAGRAMIILGDANIGIDPGFYHINGFVASPLKILEELDDVNHSTVTFSKSRLFPIRLKHYFISLLNKTGLHFHDPYYEALSLNSELVFNDNKAQTKFGWEPKFDLQQTVKDAMTWFTSHQL